MKRLSRLVVQLLLVSLFLVAESFGASQDQPSIAKDSVQMTAFTFNVNRGNYDVWSWVRGLEFRVNGPIASGSQLYAEFSLGNHASECSLHFNLCEKRKLVSS